MTYKLLFTVFLTSLSSLVGFAPIAVAQEQERPKCYLIDESGQLTDLTDICNASQKRSQPPVPAANEDLNIINNNIIGFKSLANEFVKDDNLYILGEENFSFDSSLIDSSYYIDNEIGSDYTAYIRQYQTAPTSVTREVLKKQVFQFDDYPDSLTSILRRGRSQMPFIIYRYQM